MVGVLAGCGSCGDDAPPAEQQDVTVRVEPDRPAAGPCGGCLNADAECQPGDQDGACGLGGADCVACSDGDVCLGDGTCGEPPPCGPDTCEGCCDADGSCVAGEASDACGSGGSMCASCGTGTTCAAGVCEAAACGPDNCAGCCDTTGACIGGDQDAACGAGGGLCSDCTASGASCNNGTCATPQSCAATCQGCCDGESCVMISSASACGAAGSTCMACQPDETCNNGACTVNMNPGGGRWNVILVSATVAPTKWDGSGWDSFGAPPDVSMDVYSYDSTTGEEWYDYTSTATDDFAPVWNEVVISNVTTEALMEGLEFDLWDIDDFVDDEICYDAFYVDPAAAAGQDITSTCFDDPATTWTWRIEPAP